MDVQNIIRVKAEQEKALGNGAMGRCLIPPHHVIFYDVFPGNMRGKIVMNQLMQDVKSVIQKQEMVVKHVHMG